MNFNAFLAEILPHSAPSWISAKLEIWQVSACKMEPQRECIMQRTTVPTQQPTKHRLTCCTLHWVWGATGMYGRCLEGVWKVFGRCLEGVWKVSRRCLQGVLFSQLPANRDRNRQISCEIHRIYGIIYPWKNSNFSFMVDISCLRNFNSIVSSINS